MRTSKKRNKKRSFGNSFVRRLQLGFIPRHGNAYQPHLVRRYGLLAAGLLIAGILFVPPGFDRQRSVLGESAEMSAEALLQEANAARREAGRQDLKANEKLRAAAEMKARDMFEIGYWGHVSPEGTEPWHWIQEAGYGYSKAGENLAKNFYSAAAVTIAWLQSPDHRKNILDAEYTEAGHAVVSGIQDGKEATIVVALYGRPAVSGGASSSVLSKSAGGGVPGLFSRVGIGMQSMPPAALGSFGIMTVLMLVSFGAHLYRDSIPVSAHHPRHRRHHGAIKTGILFVVSFGMLVLYGSGQL